jgi:hypothetical protein
MGTGKLRIFSIEFMAFGFFCPGHIREPMKYTGYRGWIP